MRHQILRWARPHSNIRHSARIAMKRRFHKEKKQYVNTLYWIRNCLYASKA